MFFKKRKFWIIVGAILLSFALGVFISRAQQEKEGIFENLKLFSQVLSLVENNYVEEVDTKKLIRGAINGMLASLNDPHTHFMEPQGYKDLQVQTQGAFGGLGIEIGLEPLTNQLMVISPIEGTPADKAGIKAADKIIEIEGKSTAGITLQEALDKLRGQKGTNVTITIKRDGAKEPMHFTITRDIIKLKAVKSDILLDNKIGYVRVTTFNQNVAKELDAALKALENEGMKGLILDLRNNPGGLLEQAIEVSNLFLDKGTIVSTKGRTQAEVKFSARPENAHPGFPLIVLVNRGSASASEIVAGAIKDNKRGLLLGTRTFGKGSVQTVMNLEDGAGIALTTAHYYTPSGICIQNTGIMPDVEVKDIYDEQDIEELKIVNILKTNNCFALFAERKKKSEPNVEAEKFIFSDKDMDLFMDILVSKEIKYTREKLDKYSPGIEKEIKIALAEQNGKKEGLRMALSYDEAIKQALSLMKGAQLLNSTARGSVQ